MIDVNAVIDKLDCLTTNQHFCEECTYNPHPGMNWPYGCIAGQRKIVADAREILAQAIPKVLTIEEAEDAEVCWIETVGTLETVPGHVNTPPKSITAIVWRFRRMTESMFLEDYGRDWRCWSARPSRRQMKDMKWNE